MPHIDFKNNFPGIRSALAYRPETAAPLGELAEILLRDSVGLSRAERELIAMYVSYLNDCFYCNHSHGEIACIYLGGDRELGEALIDAAANSTFITDAERKGYSGFAKTIKAYQLLLLLNLTNNNGIRIDVSDPDNPGPVVMHDDALVAIAALLNEGNVELGSVQVSFPLSSGFVAFNSAAGLAKVNRALAARVAVYQKQWATALTALNESFYNLNGNFNVGVFDVFGNGSGDQLNPAFIPQNQAGEVRVAHPSYSSEIEANDNRIVKATLRNAPASNSGLSSDRDVWVYTSSTAPVPIVRNEELILINAEANIQLNNLQPAVNAINIIRKGHNLPDYSGALTQPALIDEMLKQRRFSLFFEGHRWVDLRRYNRLATLPVDRAGDDVWVEFPLPSTE